VARVGDVGKIPRGVPLPHLPDFGLFSFSLVTIGVAPSLLLQWPPIEQLDRTGSIEGPVRAFEATAVVGEST
jgi:SulP family sulfate permease